MSIFTVFFFLDPRKEIKPGFWKKSKRRKKYPGSSRVCDGPKPETFLLNKLCYGLKFNSIP